MLKESEFQVWLGFRKCELPAWKPLRILFGNEPLQVSGMLSWVGRWGKKGRLGAGDGGWLEETTVSKRILITTHPIQCNRKCGIDNPAVWNYLWTWNPCGMVDGNCTGVQSLGRRMTRVLVQSLCIWKIPVPRAARIDYFSTCFPLSCQLRWTASLKDQGTTLSDLCPLTFHSWLYLRMVMKTQTFTPR